MYHLCCHCRSGYRSVRCHRKGYLPYRLRLHFLLRDHAGHRQGARGHAPHVGGCHRVFGHVHLKLAVSFAALEGPRLSNRLLSRRPFDGEALRFLAPDRDDVISKVT